MVVWVVTRMINLTGHRSHLCAWKNISDLSELNCQLNWGLYTPPPSPPETPGIQRTQIPECLGVTRAKSAYLFQEESGGVHRKPAYSSGVRGIRPDFFRWASPLDSGGIQRNNQTPAESSGIQWTPAELIYSILI